MAYNTTKDSMYIIEREYPFERLQIQFVPREVKVPRSANVSDITIVGRNDQLQQFISGKETVNIQLEFLSDQPDRRDVISKVDWLKSLTMVDGKNGRYRNVILSMGKLFQGQLWTVRSVDPTMTHLDGDADWLPIRAKVDITLKRNPKTNLRISDVRRWN